MVLPSLLHRRSPCCHRSFLIPALAFTGIDVVAVLYPSDRDTKPLFLIDRKISTTVVSVLLIPLPKPEMRMPNSSLDLLICEDRLSGQVLNVIVWARAAINVGSSFLSAAGACSARRLSSTAALSAAAASAAAFFAA